LEQHGLQTRQMIFQTFFTVGIEEELGIRQTRTNDFLVTGDNLDRIFRFDVGNEDKFGSSLPSFAYTGKYFWSPFMV
jgi:hypothetical protein